MLSERAADWSLGRAANLPFGDSMLGVRFGQGGDGEEGEDAAGVGVCANESAGPGRQEGEGIREGQRDATQESE